MWSERTSRALKQQLATETCQVQGENAYYGHLVWRLLTGLILLYRPRVLFKGRLTMEEIFFNLQRYWRFLNSELLELCGLSWDLLANIA
jgi:hypothetical protein